MDAFPIDVASIRNDESFRESLFARGTHEVNSSVHQIASSIPSTPDPFEAYPSGGSQTSGHIVETQKPLFFAQPASIGMSGGDSTDASSRSKRVSLVEALNFGNSDEIPFRFDRDRATRQHV